MMENLGLKHITKVRNDPLNSIWFGVKGSYNFIKNKDFYTRTDSNQNDIDIQKNFELRSVFI